MIPASPKRSSAWAIPPCSSGNSMTFSNPMARHSHSVAAAGSLQQTYIDSVAGRSLVMRPPTVRWHLRYTSARDEPWRGDQAMLRAAASSSVGLLAGQLLAGRTISRWKPSGAGRCSLGGRSDRRCGQRAWERTSRRFGCSLDGRSAGGSRAVQAAGWGACLSSVGLRAGRTISRWKPGGSLGGRMGSWR